MDRAERLALALRLVGWVMILALPCAALPRPWMEATHAWLGLGEMPRGPIVDYLARSESLLYALFGALCLVVANDVLRYQPLIEGAAGLSVLLGAALLFIDLAAGLPAYWTWGEAPLVTALAAGLWYLARSAKQEGGE